MKALSKKMTLGIVLLSLMASIGCSKQSDQAFDIGRTSYNGAALRTDGYYRYTTGANDPYERVVFLYRNGILLYGNGVEKGRLSDLEAAYASGAYYDQVKDDLSYWGLFLIHQDSIVYERRARGDLGLVVRKVHGKITSDTSFLMTISEDVDGTNRIAINELYDFKPFSPKPDSANTFIK
jgi:hypothetical protein